MVETIVTLPARIRRITDKLISVIDAISASQEENQDSLFYSEETEIDQLLRKIAVNGALEKEFIILAFIIMDRLNSYCSGLLSYSNRRKALAVSFLLALKSQGEFTPTNEDFAETTDFETTDVCLLE